MILNLFVKAITLKIMQYMNVPCKSIEVQYAKKVISHRSINFYNILFLRIFFK